MQEFDGLIGQEVLVEQLHHAIQSNRVAHAYLISGEAGSGKRALARAFTEALFCKNRASSPCGECDNCRLIKGGNHPDVTIVEPQGARIRIDQIRALQDKFALRTYGGHWKVGIIVDAEVMTAAAANSLLKLLEEPSGQAVIMLLTTSPSLLLPTIVSRCQTLSLKRIPRARIAAHLENEYGTSAEKAMVIAGLADGSLGQAREIVSGDHLAWRERILTVMTDGEARGLGALRLAATLDGAPEAIEFAMHVLTTWFRDLMLVAKGCSEELVVHQDYLPDLLAESKVYNVLEYQAAVIQIEDTLRAIRGNANRRLALDALLYQIVDLTSLSKASEVYNYGKSGRR
ncbi:MAG: DNA polymerase III subunit delta' [Firmicutes bacterium]|nr:DNA polymerase III subunit delta' [Bacillota bacterium]